MEVQEVKEQLKSIFRQVINNDKWITIHPNGEDGKGRHLLLKDGETPKEAIERTYDKGEKSGTKEGSKDISKEEHTKIKEQVSKMSDDELVKAHFESQKGYESETPRAGSMTKHEATYGEVAQELKRRTGRGFSSASTESEIKEALSKAKSDTKDGGEYSEDFKKLADETVELERNYLENPSSELAKQINKNRNKLLSNKKYAKLVYDKNIAKPDTKDKQPDSKGEKANKYRSKFSDIQNLVGSITPGEQFFDSKIRMAEKRLNDKLEAWEKDYEKEIKPAVKQMKKRNIETVKEELKQINKLKADNSKEQDMALIEELKKLITKVENTKGEEEMEIENEKVDKRKLIDEVGGILKGKVDDEVIRTIIGKMEKMSYDDSEASADNKKVDNEDEEDEEKVEELKEEEKKDVDNKCKNSKEENYFDKLNKIYNSAKKIEEPSADYESKQARLEAGKEYFG